MPVFYSHLNSYFGFTKNSQAQVIFPGYKHIPPNSYGYVRATLIKSAAKYPFRDYPNSVKTPVTRLFGTPYDVDRFIISARNVLNEWPYQARIKGRWFRRHGDPDVPEQFPVLLIQSDFLKVVPFSDAVITDSDMLTGLPLVIDFKPKARNFIIANSSDVAHSYECHPDGRFGPKPPAWQKISDQWHIEFKNWLLNRTLSEKDRTDSIDNIAKGFTGWPTGSHTSGSALTHSIIVDFGNEHLYGMVLTGTLWRIASYLASKGAKNAFVLDQSGSVCYCYLAKGESTPKPIISTTNWRDAGTCFLVIETGGFVPQVQHIWMP